MRLSTLSPNSKSENSLLLKVNNSLHSFFHLAFVNISISHIKMPEARYYSSLIV